MTGFKLGPQASKLQGRIKKKEAKKAKRDAYYANLRPMDLGDQENENI